MKDELKTTIVKKDKKISELLMETHVSVMTPTDTLDHDLTMSVVKSCKEQSRTTFRRDTEKYELELELDKVKNRLSIANKQIHRLESKLKT